jgi:UDP-glucuronate decarboxylase
MRPDDGRVVPTFVTQALRDNNLTVYGDGEQTRSFCYVDDLIRGLRALMDADKLEHSVYNLGNNNEQTIVELAETVLGLVETASEIVYESLPEDDPSRRCPTLERAREDFGYQPGYSLEGGLERTIPQLREHLDE